MDKLRKIRCRFEDWVVCPLVGADHVISAVDLVGVLKVSNQSAIYSREQRFVMTGRSPGPGWSQGLVGCLINAEGGVIEGWIVEGRIIASLGRQWRERWSICPCRFNEIPRCYIWMNNTLRDSGCNCSICIRRLSTLPRLKQAYTARLDFCLTILPQRSAWMVGTIAPWGSESSLRASSTSRRISPLYGG